MKSSTRFPLLRQRLALTLGLGLLSTLGLAACSGGGSGSPGSGTGPGATSGADRFLVFAGSLKVVDPRDPAAIFTLSPDTPDGLDFVVEGTFDAATRSLDGASFGTLVWGEGDRVLALDLDIVRAGGAAAPPDVQELAIAMGTVTGLSVEEDFSAGGGRLTFVVETASGYEVFTDDAGSVSASLSFPGEPVASLLDPTTGAFAGWLALESGSLTRVQPDLTSATLSAAGAVVNLGRSTDGDVFLTVDGELMSYDLDAEDLVDLGWDFVSAPLAKYEVADGELFFTTQAGTNAELLKTDVDGPVLPLDAMPDAIIEQVSVLTDRVVCVVRSVTVFEASLESLFRTGGGRLTLDTTPDQMRIAFDSVGALGDTVFYNVVGASGTSAHAVRADGGGAIVHPDSTWLYPEIAPRAQLDRPLEFAQLLLFTTHGPMPSTLGALDPGDPTTVQRQLGEVETRFAQLQSVPSFGSARLVTGVQVGGAVFQSDVFLLDSAVAGSLVQVTDTPGESEVGLF